jgi:hypothetical protein
VEHPSLGYEFAREDEARGSAAELDRRFADRELKGLRIYRVRWNGNYLVEAVFADDTTDSRLQDARALLGEATDEGGAGLPDWIRRFFGGRY